VVENKDKKGGRNFGFSKIKKGGGIGGSDGSNAEWEGGHGVGKRKKGAGGGMNTSLHGWTFKSAINRAERRKGTNCSKRKENR